MKKALILGIMMISSFFCFLGANNVMAASCNGYETNILPCSSDNSGDGITNSDVWTILLFVINILTAGIGVLAVGGIVYSSIMYASAGGNLDQVKKAKEMIRNVIVGIAAYALMYALLNWLIPGGVFN